MAEALEEVIRFDHFYSMDGDKWVRANLDSRSWKHVQRDRMSTHSRRYEYYHCWDTPEGEKALYRVKKGKGGQDGR